MEVQEGDMVEAIKKIEAGPLWAFLIKVATLLHIPVDGPDMREKLEAALDYWGGPPSIVSKAMLAAVRYDDEELHGLLKDALIHARRGRDPEWDRYYQVRSRLEDFLHGPSWSRAMAVAARLRDCKDEAVAACLLAATTARDVRAFAVE